MKLTIQIVQTNNGVECRTLDFDGGELKSPAANTFAIGMLEIAKASLLAQRWGVNIGDFKQEPLVTDSPPDPTSDVAADKK